jgi:clathrin heavy chain
MKERSKKEVQKEQQEADMPIMNPGFNGPLLLTQGNGYPSQVPPMMMPNGTGMPMAGMVPVGFLL